MPCKKQGLWGLSTSFLHLLVLPQLATARIPHRQGHPARWGLGQTCCSKPGAWAEPLPNPRGWLGPLPVVLDFPSVSSVSLQDPDLDYPGRLWSVKMTALSPWLTGLNSLRRLLCLLKVPGVPGGGVKGKAEISLIPLAPSEFGGCVGHYSGGQGYAEGNQPTERMCLELARGARSSLATHFFPVSFLTQDSGRCGY